MYRVARPDAVIIATPHTAHFEQGMQALTAGCHVLMEKPMVTSAAQAHALAEKVRGSGKVFIIGYNTPCTPHFLYVRDVIRKQTFGKLEMVSGYLAQNWLRYTGGTWRQNPDLSGGGEVYDSGAHLLNSLCWSVESNVQEVFAWLDRKGLAVDVNSCIGVRFENGVTASLIINGNCPVDHGALSFFFENGKIDVDGWYAKWIRCWHGQHEVQPDLSGGATVPSDNFIDAILGRDEPRTSPANGIVHSELVDAVYESARTGLPARPKRWSGA
jgi:predicted dehydrogenase